MSSGDRKKSGGKLICIRHPREAPRGYCSMCSSAVKRGRQEEKKEAGRRSNAHGSHIPTRGQGLYRGKSRFYLDFDPSAI